MSRQSLWVSLLLLLMPLCAAAETHGTAAELSWPSIVWSAMIVLISAYALFMFGILLIYHMHLLSEMLIFRSGLYDLLYGLICEGLGQDEVYVRQAVYSTWSALIKYLGRLLTARVFQRLLGFRLAEYWIILWKFQCQFYIGMCKGSIAPEEDSYILILIKIVECLLSVLGGRRFGHYWVCMTVLGPLLQTLLIGILFWWLRLWLRLGLYRS